MQNIITLKKYTSYIGLGLTWVMAILSVMLCFSVMEQFSPEAVARFHVGIDMFGAGICVVLFYGCLGHMEKTAGIFIQLILMNSASFVINELMWIISGEPQHRLAYFWCCVASKLLNLAMIYFFYRYVRDTLQFEGDMAKWADRGFPALLIFSIIVVLSNAFYPVSFIVDAEGTYSAARLPWLEDLFLIVVSLITAFLIRWCKANIRQKWAAMSFILIPIAQFVATGGAFAYSTQYASVLLSLILMYCIIFGDRSKKLEATKTELAMASRIQVGTLPSVFPPYPDRSEFDLYASMTPAKEVGGDFYDFFMIDDDHLGLIIADVSGKGIPAALFMMVSKTIIQNYARLGFSVSELLERTNNALCQDNDAGMFVTVWAGILEISTGELTCANAGHEYPAVCSSGRFELLKDKHGLILGGLEGLKYSEYTISLEEGDKVFVYTDGIPEAADAENNMFGTERMIKVLNRNAGAGPEELLRAVRKAVDDFTDGAAQFDDLTMLCLQYNGNQ